ncbi:protein of unknown function [Pararobbsia alpina]
MKRRLCSGSSAGCAFANEQQKSIGVIALLENNIVNIFLGYFYLNGFVLFRASMILRSTILIKGRHK